MFRRGQAAGGSTIAEPVITGSRGLQLIKPDQSLP